MTAHKRAAAASNEPLKSHSAPTAPVPQLLGLARRSIAVSAVVGSAAMVAAAVALVDLRQHHLEASTRTLQHLAHGLAAETARQIGEADRDLLRIAQTPRLAQDREERDRVIPASLAAMPAVAAIAYVDSTGRRYQYGQPRAPAALWLPMARAEEGFVALASSQSQPAGLFVQRTVPGSGALVARISERHLGDLYAAWRGNSPVAIALTTSENDVLIQHPEAPVLSTAHRPETPYGHAITPQPAREYRHPTDGRMFLVVSQKTPGYPLTVHAAMPRRDALSGWAAQGAVLMGALVSLALLMLVMVRRHAFELAQRAAALKQLETVQSALTLEEAKLQAMFRTALESIIVIDERGVIERLNPTAEHTFGYSGDELVGRNVSTLMPQPHRDFHDGYIQRYLRTNSARLIGSSGRELVGRRKDGTEFPIHLRVAEQRIAGVRRFTGTVRDITQEKLSESIQRAQSRIASLLSSARTVDDVASDVVAALCDLGFMYGHWLVRDSATRTWRVRAHSSVGAADSSAIEPLLAVASLGPEAAVSRAWHSGEVVWLVQLETHRDSPKARAAAAAGLHGLAAVPVSSGGEVVAVIELFSRQADPRNDTLESALRIIGMQLGQLLLRVEAEERLQTIVRTVPSAVFQARVGERRTVALTFMSDQVEALWGVSAKAVLARPRQVLWKIPPAYRRDLLRALSRAVVRGSGWDVTVPILKQGGLRWVRVHAAPAFKAGEPPTWDGIISDVTEQKLAEQQVVRLNLELENRVKERTQELAAVNKELEAFSESVSHDLRAPLRGIRSYAEMLKKSGLVTDRDGVMMVERIVSQGEQMENLIQALLELSQISRHQLRRSDTDLTAMATAVLQSLAAADDTRDVQWQVQPGLRVYADPRLMRIVIENLLANAWKFTRYRVQARIEVGALRDARDTFYVRDNGAGFDPAYADKLFQPFQRLHSASEFEGTGVGLATVQRIVRRHGGRLWAESQPDRGATFYFEVAEGQDANDSARP